VWVKKLWATVLMFSSSDVCDGTGKKQRKPVLSSAVEALPLVLSFSSAL